MGRKCIYVISDLMEERFRVSITECSSGRNVMIWAQLLLLTLAVLGPHWRWIQGASACIWPIRVAPQVA